MGYITRRTRTGADGTVHVRWRARWTDLDGRQREKQFDRRRDAQTHIARQTVEARFSGRIDPGAARMTFGQWWDEWAEVRLWAPETARAAQAARDGITFADVPLADLTRRHIERWIKNMTTASPGMPDGLAPSTVRLRYSYIHRCLTAAVRQGIIGAAPSTGVGLPIRPRGAGTMRLPTPAQVEQLILAAPDDFTAYVQVLATAGLRRGEAAGLTLTDLDREASAIHVVRQAQTINGRVELRMPKWGEARIVHVPASLLEVLFDHFDRHGGLHSPDHGTFLFTNSRGGLLSNSAIQDRWHHTRTTAGIPDVRLHDLRHYFASRLIAQGVDVVTVQHELGHASPTTTLKFYAHLWPRQDQHKLTQEDHA